MKTNVLTREPAPLQRPRKPLLSWSGHPRVTIVDTWLEPIGYPRQILLWVLYVHFHFIYKPQVNQTPPVFSRHLPLSLSRVRNSQTTLVLPLSFLSSKFSTIRKRSHPSQFDSLMGRALPFCCITVTLALVLLSPAPPLSAAVAATEEKTNRTSLGGIFWATGKDESDFLTTLEVEDPSAVDKDSDELDGGFSSLDSMLQWAIGYIFFLPHFIQDLYRSYLLDRLRAWAIM